MRLVRYPHGAALLLLVTTTLLAGCSAADLALTRKACAQNHSACRLVLKELEAELSAPLTPMQALPLAQDQVPDPLIQWARSESAAQMGGFAYPADGFTYLAISGGLRPSGGWEVQVDRVLQVANGYRVEASLLPPTGPAIDALLPAIGFFRLPQLNGTISFAITSGPDAVGQPEEVKSLTLQAAAASEAPAELQSWVAGKRSLAKPEGKVITSGSESWIALSGGQRPTGGYRVEVERTFQLDGTWIIQATVIPPAPGMMVTQALSTPTAYYQTNAITGPVEIHWTEAPNVTPLTPSLKR